MLSFDLESAPDQSDETYNKWKSKGSGEEITAPANYKDPVKIEEYIANKKLENEKKFVEKMGLSPLTGKIILFGCLIKKPPTSSNMNAHYTIEEYNINSEVMYAVHIGHKPGTVEQDILVGAWELLGSSMLNDGTGICSYNGKAFDLPFIMNRSLINHIDVPRMALDPYLNKYRHQPHLDVFNWFGSGSLVEWSYKLGLTDSLERDGYKIGQWYQNGEMDKIKDKNLIDITQTYILASKIKQWL